MKRLILLVVLLLVSCQADPIETEINLEKNVEVMEVTSSTYQLKETYIGYTSTDVLKHSFLVDGTLSKIHVSKGDTIQVGDVLAELDQTTLKFGLDAAVFTYETTEAQYLKAVEGRNYAKAQYEKVVNLKNDGIASDAEFDQAELNYKLAQSDVNTAYQQLKLAEVDVSSKTYLLDESMIVAHTNGVVIDVLNEENELVASGYPIIITRPENVEITFGITLRDLNALEALQRLKVDIDGVIYLCDIDSIGDVPDATTHTYPVTLSLEQNITIGQMVDVKVPVGDVEGVMIPIGAIRSDGTDYVFVIEDNTAKRCPIDVVEIVGQEVVVTGLSSRAKLVIAGLGNLQHGDLVKVVDHD